MASGNPLVDQGFLNRIKGALSVTSYPALNIPVSYQAKEGIVVTPQGNATDIIATAAGTVGSQQPYLQVNLRAHLLRTQSLASSWNQQLIADTKLGEIVVTSDSTVFDKFTFRNVYIMGFSEFSINGSDVGYVVNLSGYMVVNNNMWN